MMMLKEGIATFTSKTRPKVIKLAHRPEALNNINGCMVFRQAWELMNKRVLNLCR